MAIATALSELRPAEFIGELDALLAIYASAMEADEALLPGRRELMRRHVEHPGFAALHVRARTPQPAGDGWPVVAFAYGFHGEPGQWWYDAVRGALSRAVGGGRSAAWLGDCLEIAEVHVHSEYQRAGIGTSMLMALTSGRPERTALLSTPDRDTTARRLYRRLGFTDLLTGYSFPGGSPPYAVMGAPLPLRDTAPAAVRPRSASPSIS
ncbi:MAG TPA: GNAT family N-acetyltransferase [Streptosporangiaceae bacterium]|nr:GNAT family N-acetyltransferase [Streptosporangiaceae bacterium]